MKANEIVDVTPEEVVRIIAEVRMRTLIHGHTHRPAVHELIVNGQAARRIVLGGTRDRQAGRCRSMTRASTRHHSN